KRSAFLDFVLRFRSRTVCGEPSIRTRPSVAPSSRCWASSRSGAELVSAVCGHCSLLVQPPYRLDEGQMPCGTGRYVAQRAGENLADESCFGGGFLIGRRKRPQISARNRISGFECRLNRNVPLAQMPSSKRSLEPAPASKKTQSPHQTVFVVRMCEVAEVEDFFEEFDVAPVGFPF